MHRPEDQVGADESDPEVDIGHCIVQIPAIHLGEPMIDTGKHTQDPRHTHYDMEVGDHEIRIMQLKIQRRVTKEDTRQTTGDEHADKTDGEQHGRGKPDIALP